ncbi:hypothetical protein [Fusibacter sp. JL216-2]|uniref:hypothetical protein n=1 Tax=Fusibacter sp. JL216-2 TaxID=3071453 RepID=UPI003D3484C4
MIEFMSLLLRKRPLLRKGQEFNVRKRVLLYYLLISFFNSIVLFIVGYNYYLVYSIGEYGTFVNDLVMILIILLIPINTIRNKLDTKYILRRTN